MPFVEKDGVKLFIGLMVMVSLLFFFMVLGLRIDGGI